MNGMGSLGWWIRSCSSKFYEHRADIQMLNTCMGIQSPGLRWPSTLVTTNTSYGARSLHHTHQTCLQLGIQPLLQLPSAWVPTSRGLREELCGYCWGDTWRECTWDSEQGGPGSSPLTVPLCFPDQPSLSFPLAPCSCAPQSLSKCCSLSLEHLSPSPPVSTETYIPDRTH